jgi:uncharacterized glyoxalase superfamily protein PhnB
MTAHANTTIIPTLRYRDAPAAIDWLCAAFGFERHLVVPGTAGQVAHAQLALGNSMIMLGSAEVESQYGTLVRQPDQAGGPTQGIYVVVADTDAVYRRARQAGATIVIEIKDEDYGGRGFTCLDPEGHIWSIGSYDPWH